MEVVYTRRAAKDMQKLDRTVIKRIAAELAAYAQGDARARNKVSPLRGAESYKLRVGDYRAIFRIEEKQEPTLVVDTVGHRKNVYD